MSYLAEYLIQKAQREGQFENLPGAGQPLKDLDETYDPNWWLKKWVERESLREFISSGVPHIVAPKAGTIGR